MSNLALNAGTPGTGSNRTALARRLASLLAQAGLESLAKEALTEAARADARVCTVAVVGEFKRGKSTLINALIGADLLPVAALPLTAVGTRVRFGPVIEASVEFLDGRRLVIAPPAIADYATERGNPGNWRGVAGIDLTAPAPVLRAPLELMDTPGLGSVFADVGTATRAVLARADVALVVLSAEQPASRRELDLVREIIASGAAVLVAENKIDLVPPAEQPELLEFVRGQIAQLGAGSDVPLFALSSDGARRAQRTSDRQALGTSGLPALEDGLRQLVTGSGAALLAPSAAASCNWSTVP
jgi:small GTP-binding protein